MNPIYNFSAGPAMLPEAVMQRAQSEFINWQAHGCSVMEMSHRSKAFIDVAAKAEQNLRTLLNVPDNYKVLFVQGGGRGQFSAVPLNLTQENDKAAFVVSGSWSEGAVEEAQQYLAAEVVAQAKTENGMTKVPEQSAWSDFSDCAYLHYCPNETVDGIEFNWVPQTGDIPLVADMSSNILSREIDVSQFGVIYAGAQKNIGPSGLSIVIVRDDLLGKARRGTPSVMNYTLMAEKDSMYNTPPTFAWYLAGLVFEWLIEQGGVAEMEKRNQAKASLLYQAIDNSDFYSNKIKPDYRSRMNVPFYLHDQNLDALFLQEAEKAGLKALKGHRSVGGMRASIYNAMSIQGVEALVAFMQEFERKNA